MARPQRIVPLDAEATTIRTQTLDAPAPTLPNPLEAAEPEPAPQATQRTPERQRLAEAIETVRQLEAEVAEAGTSISEAEDRRISAFRALRDAEQMLQRAKPREAVGFTPWHKPPGAFWSGTYGTEEEADRAAALADLPPVSIADAKAAVAAAQDEYDSAKRSEQFFRDRSTRASDRLASARFGITAAVRLVVRNDPALVALASEARRLATRAAAAAMAFETATGSDVIQPGSPFYGCTRPADARTSPEAREDWTLSRAWSEALEALTSDPDVALPMPPAA